MIKHGCRTAVGWLGDGGGGGGGSQSNNSGTQGEGHQLRGWRTAVDIYSYVICSGLKYN